MSGAFRSAWACLSTSQLPACQTDGLGALHALDAHGQLGRQQPLSVASTASLRIAGVPTMMDDASPLRRKKLYSPGVHGGLGEAVPQLLAVPLIRRHSSASPTTTNSFFYAHIWGSISSHEDVTSG